MFISLRELYKKAEENNVAIGAFNTNNLEVTQAIVLAANELKLPLIIQTTPSALEYAGLDELFSIIKNLIDESSVPMVAHLDHAKELEIIGQCLEKGYRSVMYDGSDLLYENNVAETKKVVELAHKFGALVEAEVGVVGRGEEGREVVRQKMTNVSEAVNFVKLTDVDSLAVSIGNIHGAPEGESLDIELLKELNQSIDIPLVLHGASGLKPATIEQAIQSGIRKINIDTQIRQAFKHGIQESVDDPDKDLREFLSDARSDVKAVVIKYLKLFNRSD
jgi:fructose-bisphosphate aldolase class II